MARMLSRFWVAALAVALVAGTAGRAQAVDAPKWVAVLFIDAQKAVGLRWMPAAGATGYKVLRSETAGSGYAEIASTAQPQHFDTTVEPGTTYYYVLQAVAGAEVSPNSEEKSLVIPGQKKVKVEPPEWQRATAQVTTEFGKSTAKVGLFWAPVPGGVAYNVYRTTTPGKDYTLVTSTAETQVTDTAVELGKNYYYVLTVLDNTFVESPYSLERSVLVPKEKAKKRKKRVKLKVVGRKTTPLWKTEKGTEGYYLREPHDIAIDEDAGLVYATSNVTKEIYVLSMDDGSVVRVIGGKGSEPGEFLYPLGLDVDSDGNLYVVDRIRQSINVFSSAGAFKTEYKIVLPADETEGLKPSPMDVLIDDDTGDMYVCDRGVHRVYVLDSNGKFVRWISTKGLEVGQIMTPFYLGWSPEGNLVVINANQTRVDTYTKEGEHLSSFGTRRAGVGAFIGISGFDFDQQGDILVIDMSSAIIQGFLPDGRYLFHVADETGEKGLDTFAPKAIAIDSRNRAYIVEGLVDRVQAFQLSDEVPSPQQEEEDEGE